VVPASGSDHSAPDLGFERNAGVSEGVFGESSGGVRPRSGHPASVGLMRTGPAGRDRNGPKSPGFPKPPKGAFGGSTLWGPSRRPRRIPQRCQMGHDHRRGRCSRLRRCGWLKQWTEDPSLRSAWLLPGRRRGGQRSACPKRSEAAGSVSVGRGDDCVSENPPDSGRR